MRRRALFGLLALLILGRPAEAQTNKGVSPPPAPGNGNRAVVARLANADELRRRLGLTPEYDGLIGVESIRVAVLDYGFEGMGTGRPYLPPNAVVVEHYDPAFVRSQGLGDPDFRKPFEPLNRHGRVMAQIVWAMSGNRPGGPQFYLLNANGPTMLRRAVRYAIDQKVDVILFSGTFEGGGNGDGRGPINRIVDEAIAAGILWINAAGNYGRSVYNGPVRILRDGYLRLRDGSDVASLRFRNRLDENTVTVTLTWNDYRDEEDAGSDKDLDLFVEDPSGRIVGSSEKVQVSGKRTIGTDETRNPRERVVLASLPAGPDVAADANYTYRIRVRANRGKFQPTDRVRILVTANRTMYLAPGSDTPRAAFEFLDASGDGELFPPADNPRVLTVGDADWSSSIGPTADGRMKPDAIVDDSRAFFTDGEISAGSSDAAAFVCGAVVLLKAKAAPLHPRDLLRIAQQGPAVPATSLRGRPLRVSTPTGLRFWQTPTRSRLVETLLNIR